MESAALSDFCFYAPVTSSLTCLLTYTLLFDQFINYIITNKIT